MLSGTEHFTGSSKRVEAHSKSSNLVVNSVALSRDLPVVTGFFEIIRVVNPMLIDDVKALFNNLQGDEKNA